MGDANVFVRIAPRRQAGLRVRGACEGDVGRCVAQPASRTAVRLTAAQRSALMAIASVPIPSECSALLGR